MVKTPHSGQFMLVLERSMDKKLKKLQSTLLTSIKACNIVRDNIRKWTVKITAGKQVSYYQNHLMHGQKRICSEHRLIRDTHREIAALSLQVMFKSSELGNMEYVPRENFRWRGLNDFWKNGVQKIKSHFQNLQQIEAWSGKANRDLKEGKRLRLEAYKGFMAYNFYIEGFDKALLKLVALAAETMKLSNEVRLPTTTAGIILAEYGVYGDEVRDIVIDMIADGVVEQTEKIKDMAEAISLVATREGRELARRFIEGVAQTLLCLLPSRIALQFDFIIDVLDPWNSPVSVCLMFGAILCRNGDNVDRYFYLGSGGGVGRNTAAGLSFLFVQENQSLEGWGDVMVSGSAVDPLTNVGVTYSTTVSRAWQHGFKIEGHLDDLARARPGASVQVFYGLPVALGGGLPLSALLSLTYAWKTGSVRAPYGRKGLVEQGSFTVRQLQQDIKHMGTEIMRYYRQFRAQNKLKLPKGNRPR